MLPSQQNQNNINVCELNRLGRDYELGKNGKLKDIQRAFEYYEQAAKAGYALAQFNLARCYGQRKEFESALTWYKEAANQGLLDAMFNTAIYYEKGIGCNPNLSEAVKYYKKAAKTGHVKAQFNLSLCYGRGRGVDKNLKTALQYYELSAKQNFAPACYAAACCYEKGIGTEKNLEKANKYYAKAALQNHTEAQYHMGILSIQQQDLTQAVLYFQKAADKEHVLAAYQLAVCYEKGSAVAQNLELAFKYYKIAAEKEHALATYQIARCYEKGYGIAKNPNRAAEYYRKAITLFLQKRSAGKISPKECYFLGQCYSPEKGGVKQNVVAAFKCYKQAAEKEYPLAIFELAKCYEQGEGTDKNSTEAIWKYRNVRELLLQQQQHRPLEIEEETLLKICRQKIDEKNRDLDRLKSWLNNRAEIIDKEIRELLVTELDLSNKNINEKLAKKLAHFLSLNHYIQSINFKKTTISEEHSYILLKALRINQSIHECNLHCATVNSYFLRAANRTIQNVKHKLCLPIENILESTSLSYFIERFAYLENPEKDRIFKWAVGQYKSETKQKPAPSSKQNITPLHVAAIFGHAHLIEALCKQHFDVVAPDINGYTALEYAAALGHVETVGALLDQGAGVDVNPLQQQRQMFRVLQLAVTGNHADVVKLLLSHPACNPALRSTDEKGDTIIHTATRYNSTYALATLNACSNVNVLNPNSLNKQGLCPIHLAAQAGHDEILNYLMAQGVDLNVKSKITREETQYSALDFAVKNRRKTTITLLLDLGANIEPQTQSLANKDVDMQLKNVQRRRLERQQQDHRTKILAKEMPKLSDSNIENLVFNGGGVKGIGHVGALLELWDIEGEEFFKNIKRVAGTSAGAINAFLLALGFTPSAVETKMKSIKFNDFMDSEAKEFVQKLTEHISKGASFDETLAAISQPLAQTWHQVKKSGKALVGVYKACKNRSYFKIATNIFKASAHGYVAYDMARENISTISTTFNSIKDIFNTLSKDYGIFPGESAIKLFIKCLDEQKKLLGESKLSERLTFAELHELHKKNPETYKDLYLVGTNISKSRTEIFSYEHTPNVLIIDAVRISMSVPFFFKPYKLRYKTAANEPKLKSSDWYVDGGVLYNYPVDIFDRMRYLQSEDITDYRDNDTYAYNKHTLGFCLVSQDDLKHLALIPTTIEDEDDTIKGFFNFMLNLVKLFIDHERDLHARRADGERSVYINTLGINTLDFALDFGKQTGLLYSGRISLRNFYNRLGYQSLQQLSFINNRLLAYLVRRGSKIIPSLTFRGLLFDQIKFSIDTPKHLYRLLEKINNYREFEFLATLPIDFNVRDSIMNQTVWHYAVQQLGPDKGKKALRVLKNIENLRKLGICLDLNANDKEGRSILDLICSNKDVNQQQLIPFLVKQGAYGCNPKNVVIICDILQKQGKEELRQQFLLYHKNPTTTSVSQLLKQQGVFAPSQQGVDTQQRSQAAYCSY